MAQAYYLTRSREELGAAIMTVPGDKSISHRALMLSAISGGECRIQGLLEGEDVLATGEALNMLGAEVARLGREYIVRGQASAATFHKPAKALDFGNAGTAARLMAGLLAPCPFDVEMTGDASLCKRPMRRATDPLSKMGVNFRFLGQDGRLPMVKQAATEVKGVNYVMETPSAQVKSAILLAGLRATGVTEIIEPIETRDHSENMLKAFGADISCDRDDNGHRRIRLMPSLLRPTDIDVPADPSSAAFPAMAALLFDADASILLQRVCLNPHRIGFYNALERMGAKINYSNETTSCGEKIADVSVDAGPLKAVKTAPHEAPSMIDEFPALAALAAYASGTSRLCGLQELRVKESDRFSAIANGLSACGAQVAAEGDDIVIHGSGGKKLKGGAAIPVNLDHRVAMTFLIFGLACENPVAVDDVSAISTSYPDFIDSMEMLGAKLVAN